MMKTSSEYTPPIAVGEYALAEAIGVSVPWLRKDRRTKRTIPFFRIGRCIRYDLDTVRKVFLSRMEGGAQ